MFKHNYLGILEPFYSEYNNDNKQEGGVKPKTSSSGLFPLTFRSATLELHLSLKKVEIFQFIYFLPDQLQVISTGSFIIPENV